MAKYWESRQYDKCFAGHLALAEQGYPLAECRTGYFYYEGIGTGKSGKGALLDAPRGREWRQGRPVHPGLVL